MDISNTHSHMYRHKNHTHTCTTYTYTHPTHTHTDTHTQQNRHTMPRQLRGRTDTQMDETDRHPQNETNQTDTHHVWLPSLCVDAAVYTPPEVLLTLPLPGKDADATLCQSGCHFVLKQPVAASGKHLYVHLY